MIIAWLKAEKGLQRQEVAAGTAMPDGTVWVDVVDMTPEEEGLLERTYQIDVPTRAEMQEIEASSRLYREGQAVYLTSTMLIKTETELPETTQVTFILTHDVLVTLRYAEPWSFRTFASRAPKSGVATAEMTFIKLLDTTIERLADLLEIVSLELDRLSQQIFRRRGAKPIQSGDFDRIMARIGSCGHILGKVRESLVDKNRLLTFADSATQDWCAEGRARLRAVLHDIQSLADHSTYTSGKVQFLLDATLGLINNNVNQQMKRMNALMIAVMWPTLVSGFFAMNVALPFPQQERMWPFYLCIIIAFLPILVGGAWWWWRHRRR